MPDAQFFTRLGLFAIQEFFDEQECARLRSEMRSAARVAAEVSRSADDYGVDESFRKTKLAEVSPATAIFLQERLLAIKPHLENHFEMELTGCQMPQCLTYLEGDFFKPHDDNSREPDAAHFVKVRRVTTVIFLNNEAAAPGQDVYGGGALTFYGLLDLCEDARWGLPLLAKTGTLIAFRSEVTHGVSPVTFGERFSVVTWFC